MTQSTGSRLARIRQDFAELTRLAWPVILSRSGVMLMALVDTIMVGRYSSLELAYLSIGLAPFGPLLVFGVGIAMGTQVVTATNHGAGRLRECGAAWRRGAPFAFAVGLAGCGLCLFGEALLAATGQLPDIARNGGDILMILGLGLPFVLLFIASNFFLEGLQRPLPGLWFMLAANVANVFLNWALIGGNAGFPELGAAGSAWSTTIIRVCLGVAIVGYIWWLRDHEALGVRRGATGGWRAWAHQRRVGYASSIAIGGESLGFGIIGLMIGRLGALALGAHAILFNIIVFTAMLAIGVSSATSVRVGYARGARRYTAGRLAAGTGLLFVSLVMGGIGGAFYLFPVAIAGFYTSDADLAAFVAPLIAFLAVVVIVDGNRIVMNSSLRGRGETWSMVVCNATAYLLIMVPLAWWLAFPADHGLIGVYWAVLVGGLIAFAALAARFLWLARRDPDDGVEITSGGN
ncbi:MAG: MATE family efflux transporter [Rhodospirillales bacterium]